MKKAFLFNIEESLLQRVREYAAPSGRSVASVICEALVAFLEGKGK